MQQNLFDHGVEKVNVIDVWVFKQSLNAHEKVSMNFSDLNGIVYVHTEDFTQSGIDSDTIRTSYQVQTKEGKAYMVAYEKTGSVEEYTYSDEVMDMLVKYIEQAHTVFVWHDCNYTFGREVETVENQVIEIGDKDILQQREFHMIGWCDYSFWLSSMYDNTCMARGRDIKEIIENDTTEMGHE
jgi:hypothetical protein